jgi:hypothetical protein
MMEKRNIEEKDAAGDAGDIDDIVDGAVGKMTSADDDTDGMTWHGKRVVSHRAGAGIPGDNT